MQLPMQYRIHVKNFQCYPKAANAIVSCNVENGTLINLHAKLQYYQSVDPLFVSAPNTEHQLSTKKKKCITSFIANFRFE